MTQRDPAVAEPCSDHLITLTEIAEITRLSVSTLRYYRLRGEGPPTFKVGRRVVARERDVRAWLEERRATDR